jgi:hypothetical protein
MLSRCTLVVCTSGVIALKTRGDEAVVALHFKALFTSPVFLFPKNVGICGDLMFTQYSQISLNTLSQKYSTMMESF